VTADHQDRDFTSSWNAGFERLKLRPMALDVIHYGNATRRKWGTYTWLDEGNPIRSKETPKVLVYQRMSNQNGDQERLA